MDPKELVGLLTSDEVKPLDSEFVIEELIMSIDGIDKKIEWYSDLKKQRIERLTGEINKLENRKNRLKEIVIATLKNVNKNSLNFPGIGRVTLKKAKGKWLIKDDKLLIEYLNAELNTEELGDLVSTKIVISKTPLNKLLDVWEKIDKLPDVVKRDEKKESLSINIDKQIQNNRKMAQVIQSVDDIDMDDMDNLNI